MEIAISKSGMATAVANEGVHERNHGCSRARPLLVLLVMMLTGYRRSICFVLRRGELRYGGQN